MSPNRWIDNDYVGHTHNEILFILKKIVKCQGKRIKPGKVLYCDVQPRPKNITA